MCIRDMHVHTHSCVYGRVTPGSRFYRCTYFHYIESHDNLKQRKIRLNTMMSLDVLARWVGVLILKMTKRNDQEKGNWKFLWDEYVGSVPRDDDAKTEQQYSQQYAVIFPMDQTDKLLRALSLFIMLDGCQMYLCDCAANVNVNWVCSSPGTLYESGL